MDIHRTLIHKAIQTMRQASATVAASGGIIGGIEMASLGAFAFFLALPIP